MFMMNPHIFKIIKNNKMEPFKQWVDDLIKERIKNNDAFNELAFLKEVKVMIEYYEQNIIGE